jgi:hypothetical protein
MGATLAASIRIVCSQALRCLEVGPRCSFTVFSPDLSLFDGFNAIYRDYFHREFPAQAFIGSRPLMRNGRFEIIGPANASDLLVGIAIRL